MLYLFISSKHAYAVPRRAFAISAKFEEFAKSAREFHTAAHGQGILDVLPADAGEPDTRIQAK